MDVTGMQKGVQQQLNAVEIPIVSEDIIWYLNRAQEQFIDRQYVLLRGKYTDNQDIEIYTKAQQAIENLRTLIVTEVILNADISSVTHFDNAESVSISDLGEDFYYYVRSQTRVEPDGDWVNNRLIEQENVQDFIKTKFNNPMFRDYLVLIEGDNIYIFYDGQSGSGVHEVALTYIHTPKELVRENAESDQTTTCELPAHTHKDIVDLAVTLARQDRKDEGSRVKREEIES